MDSQSCCDQTRACCVSASTRRMYDTSHTQPASAHADRRRTQTPSPADRPRRQRSSGAAAMRGSRCCRSMPFSSSFQLQSVRSCAIKISSAQRYVSSRQLHGRQRTAWARVCKKALAFLRRIDWICGSARNVRCDAHPVEQTTPAFRDRTKTASIWRCRDNRHIV
jgi:hypothetical protein